MSSYLVTGGAGFIGSHITAFLLEKGESVRVLDNFSTGCRANLAPFIDSIDLIEGDLRNPEDCRRAAADVDYVLHQGAVPSVPRSVADPFRSHEANITGTLNLLEAARGAKVKRVVIASSSSVYGDQEVDRKHEGLPVNPLSPYAATKAACEHYLRAYSECFGMETIALRYFNVFGPRQDPDSPYSAVIPLFINAMLEGRQPVIYGDGLQARDFTFVENCVRANILAATADCPAAGRIYNIACGGSSNLLQLIDALNSILGTEIEAVFAEARPGDVHTSMADISRAEKELGYSVGVSFEEGLQRSVEYYRTFRA